MTDVERKIIEEALDAAREISNGLSVLKKAFIVVMDNAMDEMDKSLAEEALKAIEKEDLMFPALRISLAIFRKKNEETEKKRGAENED